MDFNVVFTVMFIDERYVCWYELYSPHLISAATQPCESQKTDNACELNFSF